MKLVKQNVKLFKQNVKLFKQNVKFVEQNVKLVKLSMTKLNEIKNAFGNLKAFSAIIGHFGYFSKRK